MHFHIEHKSNNQIIGDTAERIAQEFGTTSRKTWTSRLGAIDLVSMIEISAAWTVIEILKSYSKGFIGTDWFNQLGKIHKKHLNKEIITIKNFILTYYEVFIRNEVGQRETVTLVHKFGDTCLYVALNDKRLTKTLIEKLPISLCDVIGKLELGIIDIPDLIALQLYPNFKDGKWQYLFAPTNKGFGKYIDRIYDLEANRLSFLSNESEFVEMMDNLVTNDKLIINHENYNNVP